MHAPTLCVLKATLANRSLWFTPLFVFTTMCTMLLVEVSELSSTDRHKCVRCVLYVLALFYMQFLSTYIQSEVQSK